MLHIYGKSFIDHKTKRVKTSFQFSYELNYQNILTDILFIVCSHVNLDCTFLKEEIKLFKHGERKKHVNVSFI